VTYTLVVTNTGPSPVMGARVVDEVPTALTNPTWTCVAGHGANCIDLHRTGKITTFVALEVGSTATFTLTGTIAPDAAGTLSNIALVLAPEGVTDPFLGNNLARDITPLTPQADLAVTKTDGATSAVPGQPVTYSITATNTGPSTVTGATVTDTFPATLTGVTWTCTATANSTCPATGTGDITALVDLAVGGTATFTATGTIASAATGTLTNTASVPTPVITVSPIPPH
jgi:uncharacterized repeat protein (TIGR01451 family)